VVFVCGSSVASTGFDGEVLKCGAVTKAASTAKKQLGDDKTLVAPARRIEKVEIYESIFGRVDTVF